ncbi:hypothetical protein D3C81_2264690 [compost metagenome]
MPSDRFQTGMTIGIVKRIAFNFRIIPCVINQHIFPFYRFGKAVVTRSELLVFIAGGKDGLRRLMPVFGLGRVRGHVYPQ